MPNPRLFLILPCLACLTAVFFGCAAPSDETDDADADAVETGAVADAAPAEGPAHALAAVDMAPRELEDWEIRVVEYRIEKNEAFSDPEQTPFRPEDLPAFLEKRGLDYYLPERGFRFRVPFHAAERPDTIDLVKRKGDVVPNLRKGVVRFEHAGAIHELAVFGPVDTTTHGDYLWLPFYDATNGETTYPGGRYLDLELDAQGLVDLDFNLAYNPLCDYNHDRYNCTLPPAENRLPFKVEAGEQTYRPEE